VGSSLRWLAGLAGLAGLARFLRVRRPSASRAVPGQAGVDAEVDPAEELRRTLAAARQAQRVDGDEQPALAHPPEADPLPAVEPLPPDESPVETAEDPPVAGSLTAETPAAGGAAIAVERPDPGVAAAPPSPPAEPPAPDDEAVGLTLEERRAQVHARAQEAVEAMRSPES
jgi:hypothetical protein